MLHRGYEFFHLKDVADACCEMSELFPLDEANPVEDFGSDGRGSFPCSPALDKITVHPALLAKVRQILDTDNIRLVQSVAWAKYGRGHQSDQSNDNQRVHMDYGNHMFGMPMPNENIQAVAAIVYYSDTEETGGATALVPKNHGVQEVYDWPFVHMPGISGFVFKNDKVAAERVMSVDPLAREIRRNCYDREILAKCKPGDVLLYGLDTWHRGTPVHQGKVRYAHNLMWKRSTNHDIEIWTSGATRKLYDQHFVKFMARLAPDQLETLGFPARDSPKWRDPDFCLAITQRYHWAGFDMIKYVHTARTPGQIPQFWQIGPYVIPGNDAETLRSDLFSIWRKMGVHISLLHSGWTYRLEFIEGPHYLDIECCFFSRSSDVIAELHLMSGDRFAWDRLWKKTIGLETTRILPRLQQRTPKSILNMLSLGNAERPFIDMVQPDAPDHLLVQFLDSADLNVVRQAVSKLSGTVDHPKFHFWSQRKPRGYLESVICETVRTLMLKHSRM